MEKIIREIIGRTVVGFDVDTLPIDGVFKEHGIDSLDMFSIITAIQDAFGIEISDTDAEKCDSIANIISLITSLQNN